MPHKTMESTGVAVRVPLNEKAKAILQKYENRNTSLFPYFEDWQYNESIKELCRMAGIDRYVTVIDPKTRKEVRRPICEIASSHMGNYYTTNRADTMVCSYNADKWIFGLTHSLRHFVQLFSALRPYICRDAPSVRPHVSL